MCQAQKPTWFVPKNTKGRFHLRGPRRQNEFANNHHDGMNKTYPPQQRRSEMFFGRKQQQCGREPKMNQVPESTGSAEVATLGGESVRSRTLCLCGGNCGPDEPSSSVGYCSFRTHPQHKPSLHGKCRAASFAVRLRVSHHSF